MICRWERGPEGRSGGGKGFAFGSGLFSGRFGRGFGGGFIGGGVVGLIFYSGFFKVDGYATLKTYIADLVIFLIADIPQIKVVGYVLQWLVCILTVVSLIDYLVKNRSVLKEEK